MTRLRVVKFTQFKLVDSEVCMTESHLAQKKVTDYSVLIN